MYFFLFRSSHAIQLMLEIDSKTIAAKNVDQHSTINSLQPALGSVAKKVAGLAPDRDVVMG